MKPTAVLATVLVAVLLQMMFARYMIGGRLVFDLVLVGVVFAALQWGPVAGMLAGTMGGLLQDALSGGIIGVGGLAKTLVGYAAGQMGVQFVIARARAKVLPLAVATVVHRLLMLSFYGMIDQRWPQVPWTAILWETGVNAACGLALFLAADSLPGAISRGRMSRRSTFSRRQW
ncbi:MAG TPA: rod shape-determining protein MreD [Vicinamibacterales bacterium]|nr:rod shape-determining protein MreD [Vicinamibacterales bacterium]